MQINQAERLTITGNNCLFTFIICVSILNVSIYLFHVILIILVNSKNYRLIQNRFSVDSKLNVMKHLNSDVANITGASHADDLPYVFR